ARTELAEVARALREGFAEIEPGRRQPTRHAFPDEPPVNRQHERGLELARVPLGLRPRASHQRAHARVHHRRRRTRLRLEPRHEDLDPSAREPTISTTSRRNVATDSDAVPGQPSASVLTRTERMARAQGAIPR